MSRILERVMSNRIYADRRDAGRALAPEMQGCELHEPIVLGLPRGGIPVAFEIALALDAPLDVLVVRKRVYRSSPSWRWGRLHPARYGCSMNSFSSRYRALMKRLSRTLLPGKHRSLRAAKTSIAAIGRIRSCEAETWSWSMMAWRPGQPCAPLQKRSAPGIRRKC